MGDDFRSIGRVAGWIFAIQFVMAIGSLAVTGAGVYAAFHFISKFW
jgi:hypothetical protein